MHHFGAKRRAVKSVQLGPDIVVGHVWGDPAVGTTLGKTSRYLSLLQNCMVDWQGEITRAPHYSPIFGRREQSSCDSPKDLEKLPSQI